MGLFVVKNTSSAQVQVMDCNYREAQQVYLVPLSALKSMISLPSCSDCFRIKSSSSTSFANAYTRKHHLL